ncbi:transcriptional regulator [Candidatus Saccharibacteria bacterium]|nr:transcriptional regulator [Candidatus Saccharibacteria bacterium]
MDITERQKQILFQIVEEYAETASPVGSVTMAKLFDVSPATIRAEMARLETLGLIAQPHTSAGRVPTDAGYRYYVNNLSLDEGTEPLGSADFKEDDGSDGLDGDTGIDGADIRKNDEKSDFERKSIERGVHAIEVRVSSQSRADAAIRGAVDTLVELTGNLGLATIDGQLYLAGISRLFTQPEFMDTSRVRAVAKLLDNLEPWLREAAPGEALNIFIGQENPIGKNSGVSLIISRFRSPFSDKSYIGVLGPTRQNYLRVMGLVRRAGRMLEEIL